MTCPHCGSPETTPTGPANEDGDREYRCETCGEYFVTRDEDGEETAAKG
jgi:transposase-like protein